MADKALSFRFNAATHRNPDERVAAWRDAFAASVDVNISADQTAAFAASANFCTLGPALLAEARYTEHSVVRDRRTIARTGGEQVILDFFTEGGFVGTVDGRSCAVNTGDCFVMDMRGTFHVKLLRGRFIGFIMPRALFERSAAAPVRLHGLVLPAGSPKAMVLGSMLTSLATAGPAFSPTQAEAIGRGTISLVAACLIEAGEAARKPQAARSSPDIQLPTSLVRLRRHIERHAADPAYDPDALARAFGLSRSSLYRLFRPQGGVAEAIRRRRADLALSALSKAGENGRNLTEIARQSGWPDARAMRRGLHTVFAAAPKELRGREAAFEPGTGDAGLKIGALFDKLAS